MLSIIAYIAAVKNVALNGQSVVAKNGTWDGDHTQMKFKLRLKIVEDAYLLK